MDVIRIHGLELDCIVGLRPRERIRAQRLRLDIALGTDTRRAGQSGRISSTLDYDRIAEDTMALLKFRRYQLVEVAAEELAAMLLGAYQGAEWVELRLEKPGALEGRAQAASIEIRRQRSDLLTPSLDGAASPAPLLKTRDAMLSLLAVPAGESLPEPDVGCRVIDRIVRGQLCADDGRVWAPGIARPEGPATARWKANGSPTLIFRCIVTDAAR